MFSSRFSGAKGGFRPGVPPEPKHGDVGSKQQRSRANHRQVADAKLCWVRVDCRHCERRCDGVVDGVDVGVEPLVLVEQPMWEVKQNLRQHDVAKHVKDKGPEARELFGEGVWRRPFVKVPQHVQHQEQDNLVHKDQRQTLQVLGLCSCDAFLDLERV